MDFRGVLKNTCDNGTNNIPKIAGFSNELSPHHVKTPNLKYLIRTRRATGGEPLLKALPPSFPEQL